MCDARRAGSDDGPPSFLKLHLVLTRRFPKDHWTFLRPGNEKRLDSHVIRTIGEWNRAQEMMLSFAESGHPTFRGTRNLERGTSKSKGGGKLSFRKTGETHNAELSSHIDSRQSA